jgi:hypothetical protein
VIRPAGKPAATGHGSPVSPKPAASADSLCRLFQSFSFGGRHAGSGFAAWKIAGGDGATLFRLPIISANELANGIAQDSQFSLTLAQVAAGAVVVLTVTARNAAGESPAGDAVEIAVP